MDRYEVTQEDLGYLIERAIVAHISPDSTHAYEKLQAAWVQIEKKGSKGYGTFEVIHEDLSYLLERAIVAHKCPDSTHAYEKLQDAWARIEARRVKATLEQ